MRRISLSRKVLLWICELLHITSEGKGNGIRRWKSRGDVFSFYCAKMFNDYGKFISVVAVQGVRRAVIILPEATFNAGRKEVALKIERFINRGSPVIQIHVNPLIITAADQSYKEAFKTDKWEAKGGFSSLENHSTSQ